MLQLVIDRSDDELTTNDVDNQWIDWSCGVCHFSRPVQIRDLLKASYCPLCAKTKARTDAERL